jgi:hypothetical protein
MLIYLLASSIRTAKKRCALFVTPVESFVRYRLYRLVFSADAEANEMLCTLVTKADIAHR